MAAYCPIGSANVDQSIIRGVAFLVLCSITLFLTSHYDFILIYLVYDFFMRGFVGKNMSFFAWIAKGLAQIFACRVEPVNAAPKVFAARIGFITCLMILLCKVVNLNILVYSLSGFLFLAAALESFFSICLGCYIYAFIKREWTLQPQTLDE